MTEKLATWCNSNSSYSFLTHNHLSQEIITIHTRILTTETPNFFVSSSNDSDKLKTIKLKCIEDKRLD